MVLAWARALFLAVLWFVSLPRLVCRSVQTLGTKVFFSALGSGQGFELWVYSAGAASVFADICSGSCSSSPTQLTAWNGFLYFAAAGDGSDSELWRTDGVCAVIRSAFTTDVTLF
jgi:ELWxxDGT repeat protein